jgi:predicted ATPase
VNRDKEHSCPLRLWRLKNFKSVAEAELHLSPLTVLVGANSSGKSSLIQSMTVISQAAQPYSSESALPLNGPFVELGDFGELRFVGAATRDRVKIGGVFSLPSEGRRANGEGETPRSASKVGRFVVDWQVELLNTSRDRTPGRAQLRGVSLSAPVTETTVERPTEGSVLFEAHARTRRQLDITRSPRRAAYQSLVRLGGQLTMDGGSQESQSTRTAAFTHRAGVPVSVFVRGDQYALLAGEWVARARQVLRDRRKNPRTDWDRIRDRRRSDRTHLSGGRSVSAMNERATLACDGIIELIVCAVNDEQQQAAVGAGSTGEVLDRLEAIRHEAVNGGYWPQLHSLVNDRKFERAIVLRIGKGEPVLVPAEDDDRARSLARSVELSGSAVADFMAHRVLYLGPLRQDPQVLYLAAPTERPGFVGTKGEYAYAVLHRHSEHEIVCPMCDGGISRMPLLEAVNHWLDAFGLADSIETVYRPRLGLEPQIVMPEVTRPLDMTAVGVGVSQILPVLVMGLHSEPGSVLLMEQPELHLHPAMQQKLGDFLLACARSGRQVIVETHSDHLVTRLRRRIAEDERDEVLDLVGLVFTKRRKGRTTFRHLEPNRYGGFDDWPEGFFDEISADSQGLIGAGMRKKNAECI